MLQRWVGVLALDFALHSISLISLQQKFDLQTNLSFGGVNLVLNLLTSGLACLNLLASFCFLFLTSMLSKVGKNTGNTLIAR